MEKDTALSLLIDVQQSFRRQIVLTLSLFSCLVSFVWASALFGGIEWTEDHMLNGQLEREFYRLRDNLPQEIENETLIRSWLTVYSDLMPTGMQATLSEDVPARYLEYIIDNKATENIDDGVHFYRGQVANYSITITVDEYLITQHSTFEPTIYAILAMIALIMLLASIVLAKAMGRRLAAPLTELTLALSKDPIPSPLSAMGRKDEIGTLARTFDGLLNRLNDFLIREKQFTRHASHEMRTPVSIIANSLSVLKLADIDDDKRNRNLLRIEQALNDISQLIDTFLMLGREDNPQRNDTWLSLNHLLKDKMANHQQRDIATEIVELTELKVLADEKLVAILLENLLSNCYRYAHSEVKVVIDSNHIEINNDVEKTSGCSQGFGFGQEIIGRICELFDWPWQVVSEDGCYRIRIIFPTV